MSEIAVNSGLRYILKNLVQLAPVVQAMLYCVQVEFITFKLISNLVRVVIVLSRKIHDFRNHAFLDGIIPRAALLSGIAPALFREIKSQPRSLFHEYIRETALKLSARQSFVPQIPRELLEVFPGVQGVLPLILPHVAFPLRRKLRVHVRKGLFHARSFVLHILLDGNIRQFQTALQHGGQSPVLRPAGYGTERWLIAGIYPARLYAPGSAIVSLNADHQKTLLSEGDFTIIFNSYVILI